MTFKCNKNYKLFVHATNYFLYIYLNCKITFYIIGFYITF